MAALVGNAHVPALLVGSDLEDEQVAGILAVSGFHN